MHCWCISESFVAITANHIVIISPQTQYTGYQSGWWGKDWGLGVWMDMKRWNQSLILLIDF